MSDGAWTITFDQNPAISCKACQNDLSSPKTLDESMIIPAKLVEGRRLAKNKDLTGLPGGDAYMRIRLHWDCISPIRA